MPGKEDPDFEASNGIRHHHPYHHHIILVPSQRHHHHNFLAYYHHPHHRRNILIALLSSAMGLSMASTPDNPLYKEQVEALFAHIETLQADKEILRVENEALGKKKKDLTKENKELGKKKKDLTKENKDLTKENKDLTKENKDLTKENKDLTIENEALGGLYLGKRTRTSRHRMVYFYTGGRGARLRGTKRYTPMPGEQELGVEVSNRQKNQAEAREKLTPTRAKCLYIFYGVFNYLEDALFSGIMSGSVALKRIDETYLSIADKYSDGQHD